MRERDNKFVTMNEEFGSYCFRGFGHFGLQEIKMNH